MCSRLPDEVDPSERLSRFLHYRRHFKNGIKPEAFMPNPKTNDTSIYRTHSLEEDVVWSIGHRYVGERGSDARPILARADLLAEKVFEQELNIEPANKPHHRHANIEGWLDSKSSNKMKALKLAESSTVVKSPNLNSQS